MTADGVLDSQPLYLEDLVPGQRWVSGTCKVEAAAIRAFAEQFDPQPFHLDPAAAQSTFFEGLAASGWHTAALTMRLVVENELKPAGGTSAPASTSCFGRCSCGQETSCTSRAKSSR